MKATRKVTPAQFKKGRLKRLQNDANELRAEIDYVAAPKVDVAEVMDGVIDLFKRINDEMAQHNALWKDKANQIKEYRAWVAATPGNEEYLIKFDALPYADKMALFADKRLGYDL